MIVLSPPRIPGTRVAIDPDRGATVRSWVTPLPRRDPQELLYLEEWADDPAPPDLPGGIPVLFPFAGRVAAPPMLVPGTWNWEGFDYENMPCHGFAWNLPWEVTAVRPAAAEFRLSADASTLALYPFPFTLRLRVEIVTATRLDLTLRIRNDGPDTMPCTPGFHPYFRLPEPGCAETSFPGDWRAVPYDATCTRLAPPPAPPGTTPAGPHLFMNELPNAFLDIPGMSFCLLFEQHHARPGVHFWQPYSRPGAPFHCLEPWTAPAGAVNYPYPACPRPIPPRQSRVLKFAIILIPL